MTDAGQGITPPKFLVCCNRPSRPVDRRREDDDRDTGDDHGQLPSVRTALGVTDGLAYDFDLRP